MYFFHVLKNILKAEWLLDVYIQLNTCKVILKATQALIRGPELMITLHNAIFPECKNTAKPQWV